MCPSPFKRFAIVEGEWVPGGDELTPTNKVKRASVNEKYADQVDALRGRPD